MSQWLTSCARHGLAYATVDAQPIGSVTHMEDENHGIPGKSGKAQRRLPPTASKLMKPGVPIAPAKPAGRHAAIQKTVPTLATYRTWSAKARTDWENKE